MKAATDPKFASFTKLVDARGAAAKALREARSKMGATLTDADRATIAQLDGKVNAATIEAKAAMASDTWTEEDRKVLRYLFTTKGSG